AVVAPDGLLIVWSRRAGGTDVGVVRHHLVAQCVDRERVTRCAHPWADPIAIHLVDGRRSIRIGAVRIVVAGTGEGGGRGHRRVHVLRLSRHERNLVTELAVLRVKERIRDHLPEGRIRNGHARRIEDCQTGIPDLPRIVHARDHHGRRIAGGIRRVDLPGRVGQAVVGAPLIGIHARDLLTAPVFDRDRQVGRGELLAELRRERIELGGEVVGDDAGEVRGDVRRGEHPELRERGGLVIELYQLAIAQVALGAGERRHFRRLREQADVVRNDARGADARPEALDAAGVALVARQGRLSSESLRRILRVGRVVGRQRPLVAVVDGRNGGLVGQDVDRASEARELHRDRRDVVVADEDVLVLFGDNYIAPVTEQFPGLGGSIYILPDQASVAAVYNGNQGAASGVKPTNAQNPSQTCGRQSSLPSGEGDTGSVEIFWPCVATTRIVPDFISLFPQSAEVAPFAGAKRNLCDRKLVTLGDQTSALAKFWVFTSAHVAAHFTGIITDDFTSEFDPFSPSWGEKFSPANLPVAIKDWTGQEVSRVYSDQWGVYNGLTYSTWEVNPP